MKYIKEYTYNEIEELSDYLQEVFDKYNIVQYQGTYNDWVCEEKMEINWIIKDFSDKFIIVCCCDDDSIRNRNYKLTRIVNTEIQRIKPIIETRLKKSITIQVLSDYYIKIII